MIKQLTYRSALKGTGGFLIVLSLFSSMSCNIFFGKTASNKTTPPKTAPQQVAATDTAAHKIADTTRHIVAKDTAKPAAPVIAPDTTPVSPELAAIRKQKGTAVKNAGDQDDDVLVQKIVHTSDQHQDVLVKEIDTVKQKAKHQEVSDKTPNTEALPSAPTSIVNTLDPSSSSDYTPANTTLATTALKDSTHDNKNVYNTATQTQMNVQLNSLYNTSLLHDSIIAINNKDFLFNNLTITNTSSQKITLLVTIVIPNDWQLVTDKVTELNIDPNGSAVIPMRILPANSNSSAWKQVRIEYLNTATGEKRNDFFSIKVQEFSKFKARLLNPNQVLPAYQKIVNIPVYIKNSGNTPGTYTTSYSNEFFHLDSKMTVKLNGGSDTTINLSLTMSENEYNMLTKEDVKVIVSSSGDAYNLTQSISKVGFMLKDHPSAYTNMPLQVEVGAVSQGNTATQYYGALYGSVDLNNNSRVSVAFRSNTISKDQTIDNGLARMDYSSKHVQASVGNIMEMTDFLMDGYGAKLGYNWGKDNKAVIYSELRSRTGDNKVFGGNTQFHLADNIKLIESISSDIDNLNKLNSTIARQTVDMKLGAKAKLAIITGVGMEQTSAKLINNTKNSILGSSFGYNFQYSDKHLNIISSLLYNSDNFAGVYKGQRLQSHDVRMVSNRFFVGGYYEYNYKNQNMFYDSALLTNVFGIRSENYGARFGFSSKGMNTILSAGQQKQVQGGENNDFQFIYNYLNLNATVYLNKKIYINLNSYAGYGEVPDHNVNNLFITSNTGTLSIYKGGIAFRYDGGPFYYSDMAQYLLTPGAVNRTLVSPYVDLSFFKELLNVRAQYNYTKTVPGDAQNQNLMMNISYANPMKGYDFHLTGTLPVNGDPNSSYLSASFRMRIDAPCVVLRKYYRLRVVLFKDENSNGIRDQNEPPIVGQTVAINGNLFVSDIDGIVEYRNVDKGTYKADFGYSSKIKGWAPRNSTIQTFEVNGNTTAFIPYRKAKVLEGKLNVEKDETSNLKFDPANIKVIVTSDDNVNYSTLTDDNGEFYFNLPSGNYTVTLSPAAFDEHFRPAEFSQRADMTTNETKKVYFEIRQKRRTINIHKE